MQRLESGTQNGTQCVPFFVYQQPVRLNCLVYMVGPHGFEPWTKGL